ncbi:cystathione beta-lyase [Leifsonia sp. 98AMF]|uniref:MalY/PatB family protein n=1 Tax=unclassified Leifsonia TaxID=2663824 RepID=UPI00087AD7DE|nr:MULTISPECIES: aminotransferase class I/II-fold pyridoxal phosphate-dependent enzyme [unclassified Leifsonia]SDH56235.1 cystathione beta-lyase [Leifsonia sp. 197AMF]SDI82787.1 cystathione beta-lyase [Leifsonia sp. 466MF]SDK01367.1 cystathione beta-lyase [Leifsonia sp. 157MF]SDN85836.1 cystathione beta-lyase [Leifsonia sp. 509MF]SEN19987.1 cystathione beta-lyase [Leifsonia sp. 467MF]
MTVEAEPLSRLRQRTSEKWRAYPDDVLPLFVAEMDYPLAPPIAAALHAAVDRSDTGYIGPDDRTQRAFVDFARDRWGWEVDPAQTRTTTDVSVVIVEALRMLIEPGDRVVITPPVYPPFFELIPEAGGVVEEVPLLEGGTDGRGWALDLAGLERAFAGGAKAFLLCNPHNPLGLVHPRAELEAVAALAAHHGVFVVSDEVHAPLTHTDATFTPFLSVSEEARRIGVAAHSASKAWNLAGLKCALFVTASPEQAERIHALPIEVEVRTSHFGRIATEAAFRDGRPWLDDVLRAIETNRELLSVLLTDRLPRARYREPLASYLAWIDLRALGWGDDPATRILEEARVAVNPGIEFGAPGAGFIRLNLACSQEVLTDAIDRIAELSARG